MDTQKRVTIIADIGVNHDGDFDKAVNLIISAARARADYVKFQVWRKNRFPEIEHLRLTKSQIDMLVGYCRDAGVKWIATPFDTEGVDYLLSKRVTIWKIPSGLVTNHDFLGYLTSTLSPVHEVWMSTGMCTWDEIIEAYQLLSRVVTVVPMHCVTAYPAPVESLNLSVLSNMFAWYFNRYGWSDHSGLPEIPALAAALGASVIECHITHDVDANGPDHKASLNPQSFRAMVDGVRRAESAMGSSIKTPSDHEWSVRQDIRGKMLNV